VEMASKNQFNDKDTLKKLLTSLKKLEESIRKFKIHQDTAKEQTLGTLKNEAKEKLEQLKAIGKLLSESNSSRIESESKITAFNADLEHFNREIVRKNNEYKFWSNLCKHESTIGDKTNKNQESFNARLSSISKSLLDLN